MLEDLNDGTKLGAVLAGIAGAAFYLRRMFRADKAEGSATEVVVSVNGGTKLLIDEFKAQLASMAERIRNLESEVRKYFDMHEKCQEDNRLLRIEVDTLKRNQKP